MRIHRPKKSSLVAGLLLWSTSEKGPPSAGFPMDL
ncbi:unnamed protein product [Menidia menidia]|uniref:(Atlantic silverside) hypothetical protein n=1 Tax=Menidia menidia TaxID=238744 RepID=A0A8S4AZ37_9TELE|nr:unnamed protein product [Menidia menidia]